MNPSLDFQAERWGHRTPEPSGLGGHIEAVDQRQPVDDVRAIPYRWICSLKIKFKEKVLSYNLNDAEKDTRFGSGILITPRHVLTNAHLLKGIRAGTNNRLVTNAHEIHVTPGRDDLRLDPSPFGVYAADSWVAHRAFNGIQSLRADSVPFDYGLITLKKDIGYKTFLKIGGQQLGWWGASGTHCYVKPVAGAFRSSLEDRLVNVAGYPYDLDSEFTDIATPAGVPVQHFDRVESAYPKLRDSTGRPVTVPMLNYRTQASSGQSGSPVWIKNPGDGRRYLVAIHAGEFNTPPLYRAGVLITPEVIAQLAVWGAKV